MYIKVGSIVEIKMKRSSNGSYGASIVKKRRYTDPRVNYNQKQSDRGQIGGKITIKISMTDTINNHKEYFHNDDQVQYLEQSMPVPTPVSASVLTQTTSSTTVAAIPLGCKTFSLFNYPMDSVQVLGTFNFNEPPIFVPQLTGLEYEDFLCECLHGANSRFQQSKIIKKETPVLSHFPRSDRWT